jgi:hypothetical protein
MSLIPSSFNSFVVRITTQIAAAVVAERLVLFDDRHAPALTLAVPRSPGATKLEGTMSAATPVYLIPIG